jgi:hypothetical protein
VANRSKRTGLGVDAILGPKRDDATAPERQDVESPKQQRIRVTVYFDPEDIVSQDEVVTEEFRRTHERVDRSELLRRAWRAYVAQLRAQPRAGAGLGEPAPAPLSRPGRPHAD